DRTPLPPLQQLRPDVSNAVVQAINYGLEVELKDRPQSVGRWLEMLTARSGNTSRTVRQEPTGNRPPTPSEMPTRVVAPGYAAGRAADVNNGMTNGKTVAVPLQTGYEGRTNVPEEMASPAIAQPTAGQVKEKGKGCGCVSTLGMLAVAIAGLAAAGGYWAMTQLSNFSLPTVELPGTELPTTDGTEENATDANDDEAAEDGTEETTELEETDADEENSAESDGSQQSDESASSETSPDETQTVEQPGTPASGAPPLLLSDSGANPGNPGPRVPVPGFSPGDLEDQITGRLGSPTREGSVGSYYTAVYDVIPNRARLGYVYEQGSVEVRQSEATFSPSTDRLVMRTTLSGMLDGRSTPAITQGLEAVRTGEQSRFTFNVRGFSGAIERNAYGHIHIYVQN
ncbi:MAG: hypothetical protein AAFY72_18585, partial [Cyanobacteria bacterium J06649_4]